MGHVDGNALAGLLAEVFPFDLTAAKGHCAHCGSTGMLGDAMVYFASPGTIVRCAQCNGVLATLVETSGRVWMNLSGIRGLRAATSSRPLSPRGEPPSIDPAASSAICG
jgi:hypothetical protein